MFSTFSKWEEEPLEHNDVWYPAHASNFTREVFLNVALGLGSEHLHPTVPLLDVFLKKKFQRELVDVSTLGAERVRHGCARGCAIGCLDWVIDFPGLPAS